MLYDLGLVIILAPLAASAAAGLFSGTLGRRGAHTVTTSAVGVAFLASVAIMWALIWGGAAPLNAKLYDWAVSGGVHFQIGFLIDRLSAAMMCIVTFVSFCVHLYTVGYMADDEHNWPGDSLAGNHSYERFFSYISLFTFSMLMLVMANNFLQLFFGWEAVGLVSYLLIGFWLTRESAIFASLKAFLVNRLGDFGFLIGIAAVLYYFGTLDYAPVFAKAPSLASLQIHVLPHHPAQMLTVVCLLLMIGAMGKSAQVPLHVWLPDSMEGPTPISALIHAATMVTAGIFMIARMSPLYEYSNEALTIILVIGGITAFFMGVLGVVQYDIKRVIAYSTLSQLGYMFAGLGASAYAGSIFHLITHACFKALLFLGAGSVIIAMHHEQDMRKMGGLAKYMPVTYITTLIGGLSLVAFPGFAGFYSKDKLIEAVGLSQLPGAGFAYWMLTLSVFVTALYTFRMIFLTFHGRERMDEHTREHLKESPWVVTVPLVLLAIPSVVLGGLLIKPFLFDGFFQNAISVLPAHDVLHELAGEYPGNWAAIGDAFTGVPVYLMFAGIVVAWYFYLVQPRAAERLRQSWYWLWVVLQEKYGFDRFYIGGVAALGRNIGLVLWHWVDAGLIDGMMVNGTANGVGRAAGRLRRMQTGYVYHYAFTMIIGLCVLLGWFVLAR